MIDPNRLTPEQLAALGKVQAPRSPDRSDDPKPVGGLLGGVFDRIKRDR